MLSNLQPLTDAGKASWAGLASTVGVDFSKVHPTLATNRFSQRASGTDTLDSIVTATYHWVPLNFRQYLYLFDYKTISNGGDAS
jgi:hypothetical protein